MNKSHGGNIGVVLGLVEKIEELNNILLENIPFAYPIGTVIYWDHGYHIRSGTVDMHANFGSPRLRVMLGTGNFIWIDIAQIKSADHD